MAALLARLTNAVATSKYGRSYRDACGHRKFGLMYDDLLAENPVVEEAIRRLSDEERQARYRRIKIASDLTIKGKALPKDQWVTDETEHYYLTPHVDRIIEERQQNSIFGGDTDYNALLKSFADQKKE
eukprot:TRINITY_DN62_c0_g1_i1.p1 TRINITY_DN62_c0_g1~~TRINITY_DN62_c0_g1_i1.p1  ORF type:complete len:128 (+),score=35.35 TRINITY_DN62_c0_g1_i1:68-451(+)